MSYQPDPLRKSKQWLGTIRAMANINGTQTPFGTQIKVLADNFERAAALVLDAGFLQSKESPQEVSGLELIGLELQGPLYFTDLDLMEVKGKVN